MMYADVAVCVVCVMARFLSGEAKEELPEEITFQVYVAFDNVLHTSFSNENLAQKYVSAFFNAINLHFQRMRNPRIKFEVVMFHAQGVPFTTPALTLDSTGKEVDASTSLHSIYNYTRTRPQFSASDILFVFSGRKVYTTSTGKKNYYPQGLTWEGGICNEEKKIVIVSDIGKHFSALPNAGFQLARLLGAPTACTPTYYQLEENFRLFNISDCVTSSISKFLRKLQDTNPSGAKECFRKRYTSSISQYYKELPHDMVKESDFCNEAKGMLGGYPSKGLCNREGIAHYWAQLYRELEDRGIPSTQGDCAFDCCNMRFAANNDVQYQFRRYYAFDGKPCRTQKDKICVLGMCQRQ